MPGTAAIFDLDRTLISGSPAATFERHLAAAGLPTARALPLAGTLDRWYEHFGENPLTVATGSVGQRLGRGWSVATVAAAAEAAAIELDAALQPFARPLLAEHRHAGRALVLATPAPEPLVAPLARRLGFDHVVATRFGVDGGTFTGEIDGPVAWAEGKVRALEAWSEEARIALSGCHAYSGSFSDALLLAQVAHPVAVNPDPQLAALAALRRWPVRHLDVPDGVSKVMGRELQEWTRPLLRPEAVPYARFAFAGLEHVPPSGPAIVVFNHRSYFDPTVMGLVAAQVGRPVRGLGKKELFDVPLVGRLARMAGGIRVERSSGSDEPLEQAALALEGGELVMIAPQGTIPRGAAFFDPELKGRWGAARLAQRTGAPVIPVGLWGTEAVWPRSSRLPRLNPLRRPLVTAQVGPPVPLGHTDIDADTRAIMAAIVAQLPAEARRRHHPTDAELRRTFPPGYRGDPRAEADRRPGTDT